MMPVQRHNNQRARSHPLHPCHNPLHATPHASRCPSTAVAVRPGQALLLERLGRHREALRLYVHGLHDLQLAEAYCDRVYEADIAAGGGGAGASAAGGGPGAGRGLPTLPQVGRGRPPAACVWHMHVLHCTHIMCTQPRMQGARMRAQAAGARSCLVPACMATDRPNSSCAGGGGGQPASHPAVRQASAGVGGATTHVTRANAN